MSGMAAITLAAFANELEKIALGKSVVQLLAGKAVRKGIDPSTLPVMHQIGRMVASDRPRAAEVAKNVSGFLKSAPQATA